MNKSVLVSNVAGKTSMTKKAVADVVEAVLNEVMKAVKQGGTVTLTGFGTFRSVRQAASVKRNPKTGAPVNVPAKSVPRFRAGKAFRELVA
jgi:DNA-binding protein HU-beta